MSMEKPTTSSTHTKSSPTSGHEQDSISSLTLSNDWSMIQLSNTEEKSAESQETPLGENVAASDESDKEYTDGYYQMAAEIDRIIYEDSACSDLPTETASGEPEKDSISDSTDDEYSLVSFSDLERLMVEDELRRRQTLRTSDLDTAMSMEKPMTSSTHTKSKKENSRDSTSSLTLSNDWSMIQLPNTKGEIAESQESPPSQNVAVAEKSDKECTISLAAEIDRIIYEDSASNQPPIETASSEPDKDSTDDEYSLVSFSDLERLMVEDELRLRTSESEISFLSAAEEGPEHYDKPAQ